MTGSAETVSWSDSCAQAEDFEGFSVSRALFPLLTVDIWPCGLSWLRSGVTMTLLKSMFAGAVILVGATVAANAQWQYPAPPQLAANPYDQAYQRAQPYGQVPAT